jgi:thiol-disulfide isomerase/thioredoxin
MSVLRSLALALTLGLALALSTPVQAEGSIRLATAAEFSRSLTNLQGRPVVLNLWGTWCAPCLKEIPDLMQLEREFAAQGLQLVAVAMDDPAEFAMVDSFRKRFFVDFDSYLRNEPDMDTLVSVVDPAWNELLPTTYLIGRDGKVLKRIQGKKSIEEFRREISALLR